MILPLYSFAEKGKYLKKIHIDQIRKKKIKKVPCSDIEEKLNKYRDHNNKRDSTLEEH